MGKANQNWIVSVVIAFVLATNVACKKDDLKKIGTIIAVGIAAKLIYDMVVEYQSEQVNDEAEVIKRYKKAHSSLPAEPTLVSYQTSIRPGDVVSVGKDISIISNLEVVRGQQSEKVDIQERITIYDNEDPDKELKQYTKPVNQDTKRSGAFANEFKFKLPKGMPQGVYPIKTEVIINGVANQPVENQMQLVIRLDNSPESINNWQLLASTD